MARLRDGASSTSNPTVEEIKQWYAENKSQIEKYTKASTSVTTLRDITKTIPVRRIDTVNKEELKEYIKHIGNYERKLRDTSRYLFYRSNVYYRIIMWYATMFNLNCRKVTPNYSLIGNNDPQAMTKSFNDTLDYLDRLNNQGNMIEALVNVFVQDVFYALRFTDQNGTFLFPIDPDEAMIDGRYDTGDFSFAINMSKYNTPQRKKIIEFIGSPLKEMYEQYLSDTSHPWIHVPDKYNFVLKFRTDTWDMVAPPLLATFIQLANLEDLVDIQATADKLSVYKLIYMPMTTISGSKNSDDFEITPDISLEYLNRIINSGAVPDDVAVAAVPGKELKTIDFSKTVDSDTNSVQQASNAILQTAGGGAVINSSAITSTAAFNAWLKAETEFAISTLLPQIDGITNRYLSYELGNKACAVKHLEVSVYTQKDLAEQLLQANQYSYSYRLMYGTLLGVSEKETLAMLYFENEVLKLPQVMKYPLASSFTSNTGETEDGYTNETGQGRPSVDDSELSPEGERSRNR